jgi:hypothetical protein
MFERVHIRRQQLPARRWLGCKGAAMAKMQVIKLLHMSNLVLAVIAGCSATVGEWRLSLPETSLQKLHTQR